METLTAEIIRQTCFTTSANTSSPPSSSSSLPSSTLVPSPITDKSAIASFFVSAIGTNAEAADYLYDILNLVDPLYLSKKRSAESMLGKDDENNRSGQMLKSAKLEEGEITPEYNAKSSVVDENFDVLNKIYINDEVDEAVITFATLMPNDQGMAAIMIGKSGDNITDIRKTTGVKTTLENLQTNSYQKDRAIFFMGKCRQTLMAYQKMLKKMIVKNEEGVPTRPGIPQENFERDPLIVIIPNEVSAKLIGKGGNTIKTLQANCDAKTSIENEERMNAQHSFGRRIFITGTIKQKLHAAYLIARFLAHACYDDLADAWKGRVPPPLVPPVPTLPPPPPLPPPPFAGYANHGYPPESRRPPVSSHAHAQYQQHYNQYPSDGYGPRRQRRRV